MSGGEIQYGGAGPAAGLFDALSVRLDTVAAQVTKDLKLGKRIGHVGANGQDDHLFRSLQDWQVVANGAHGLARALPGDQDVLSDLPIRIEALGHDHDRKAGVHHKLFLKTHAKAVLKMFDRRLRGDDDVRRMRMLGKQLHVVSLDHHPGKLDIVTGAGIGELRLQLGGPFARDAGRLCQKGGRGASTGYCGRHADRVGEEDRGDLRLLFAGELQRHLQPGDMLFIIGEVDENGLEAHGRIPRMVVKVIGLAIQRKL